jgi:methionyl-tRNA formyltransferase
METRIGKFGSDQELNILFLGYDRSETCLIDFLEELGNSISHSKETQSDLSAYDLCVSFGYRHILSEAVIKTARRPVINLHISYLPFNRGAHPNFWSWIEGTPSGVTIHEIDAGIDTGRIIFQDRLNVSGDHLTFSATYTLLFDLIENLLKSNSHAILSHTYSTVKAGEKGTSHRSRDLPKWMTSWDMKISEARRIYNERKQ